MFFEEFENGIFVIWFDNVKNIENRLNSRFVSDFETQIEIVLKRNARAIVFGSKSKYFSNGLDLNGGEENEDMLMALEGLVKKLLFLGVPTIAMMNGHAFGGGLMLAMACDYRIMAKRKGWCCIPAIDLKIPLPYSLINMMNAKIGNSSTREVLLTGHRYTGIDAKRIGIVGECFFFFFFVLLF